MEGKGIGCWGGCVQELLSVVPLLQGTCSEKKKEGLLAHLVFFTHLTYPPTHPSPSPPPLTPADHCIWLNNCVGRQNIVAFYTVLVGAACMLGTQIVVGCFDIVGFANGSWGSRQGAMYPSVSPLGTFIPMLAVWVLCIAVVALVAQLFSFHALLVLRNITTFDYIVQRGQARNGQEVTPGHGSSLGTWFAGYQRPGGAKVGGVEGGRAAHAAALAAGVPTVPTVEASLTVRDINITVGGVGATRQAPPAPAAAAPEEVDAYSSEPGDVFNRPVRI